MYVSIYHLSLSSHLQTSPQLSYCMNFLTLIILGLRYLLGGGMLMMEHACSIPAQSPLPKMTQVNMLSFQLPGACYDLTSTVMPGTQATHPGHSPVQKILWLVFTRIRIESGGDTDCSRGEEEEHDRLEEEGHNQCEHSKVPGALRAGSTWRSPCFLGATTYRSGQHHTAITTKYGKF